MKKAHNLRLSLRKLFIATMAVGPLAVLPSPLWAVVPTSTSYTVTNGTASLATSVNVANISTSDRAVLVWGTDGATGLTGTANNFNIAVGETYNFILPSGGAVLNRVTKGAGAGDAATIAGTLFSNGRVFVLSDSGNIAVANGALINTQGGLVLSTLNEGSSGAFTSFGDITYTGGSNGDISIGTATVSGNFTAIGGAITAANAPSVAGDLVLRSVTSAAGITLGTSGISGNLSVTTNNATITHTGGITVGTTNGTQTTTLSSGTGDIVLGLDANDFKVVAVQSSGASNVSLYDANIITLAASTIGSNLSVIAGGQLDTTAIASSGALAIGGDAFFYADGTNSAINIASGSSIAGVASASTGNGVVTINTVGNLTTGIITSNSGGGIGRNIVVTSNAVLTIGDGIVTANNTMTPTVTLTGGSVVFGGPGGVSNSGPVIVNSTAGNVTLGTITSNRVASTALGGSISQLGGSVITTSHTSGTSAFTAVGNNITLNELNAFGAGAAAQFSGNNVSFRSINHVALGTTNATGNVAVTTAVNRNITLGTGIGTGVGQNIVIGGNLSATTSGTGMITDNDYSALNITGALMLTTGSGNITLNAANALGSLSPSAQFGKVNASTTGEVFVVETTTLNLGDITATNLVGTSLSGDIIDSGILNVSSLAYFSLPGGSLTLGNTSSTIGRISVQGGVNSSILSNSTLTLHDTTNATGNLSLTTGNSAGVVLTGGNTRNLMVNSNGTVSLTTGTTSVSGNLDLMAAGAVTDTVPGAFVVAGSSSLNSATSLVLDGANDFRTLVITNSTGQVTIRDINSLTISGNTTGELNVAAGAGTIANPWSLILGNVHSNSLIAVSGNGSGGASGPITQLGRTNIHSETTSEFRTRDANIVIANNGNSFGRVQLFVDGTSGSRTVILVEDSTLKLGNLSSRGTTTLTSRFGSIIEDSENNVVITNNGTLATNAVSGSVLLGNTTHTSGTTTGNVTAFTANAPMGAVAVFTNNQVALGNVTALSLTATATNNITQSGRLNIFGTTNITAGRNITLSNTTNNFGRVFLTTSDATNGNIQIVEGATLNLGGVTMAAGATANFTATSVSGDIIDTGLGGVRPGGTIGSPGTGSVSFRAVNGNITLDDPTTDLPTNSGVSFTGGNVTLAVLGQAPLLLGATGVTSTATNLAVTSATGNIGNNGNLTVTGDATFQTGNGNITLTQPENRFGAVRFNAAGVGGSGQARINQANDINIITGSSATGLAEFVAGTYITIDNRGGSVSLGSTGNFTAVGSIVLPKLIQAVGNLTVNSPSLKDLGALSQAADLSGKAPVNLGTGTYVAPAP